MFTVIMTILFAQAEVMAQCDYSRYKTFSDSNFVKNDQIICPHITYVEPGSSRILIEQSQTELQKIADFIQKNSTLKFELGLYTEHLGNNNYNLKVAEQRAVVVKNYLVTVFSLNPEFLVTKGYGEEDLIFIESNFSTSLTLEEKSAMHNCNRRTVLKVVDD